jgi:hypothetical protein
MEIILVIFYINCLFVLQVAVIKHTFHEARSNINAYIRKVSSRICSSKKMSNSIPKSVTFYQFQT